MPSKNTEIDFNSAVNESIQNLLLIVIADATRLKNENEKLKNLLAKTVDNLEESLALVEDKFDIETRKLK